MNRLPLLLPLFLIFGCSQSSQDQSENVVEIDLPEHISSLENLTVYSPNPQTADTLELVRETIFESNSDVIINGYIRDVVIDDMDRVYIYTISTDSRANNGSIYVFNPDGSFLNTVGRYGRGPGEYTSVRIVDIMDDEIHVVDNSLNKIITYSAIDFSFVDEYIIDRSRIPDDEILGHAANIFDMFSTRNHIVLKFLRWAASPEDDMPYVQFYKLSDEGTVLPEKVLEVDRYQFFFPGSQVFDLPFVMPFTRHSLVRVSQDGSFFVNWTEDFLIKIFDHDGNYVRAFYYPVEQHGLSVNQLDISDTRRRVINDHQLPETWPRVHTMELDDEGRIWVATITDSDSSFQWLVLNTDGSLAAKFHLSGERIYRQVTFDPVIKIKNGYFYTRQQDIRQGVDRIIKSRIVIR